MVADRAGDSGEVASVGINVLLRHLGVIEDLGSNDVLEPSGATPKIC